LLPCWSFWQELFIFGQVGQFHRLEKKKRKKTPHIYLLMNKFPGRMSVKKSVIDNMATSIQAEPFNTELGSESFRRKVTLSFSSFTSISRG